MLESVVDDARDLCRQLVALGLAALEGDFLHPDPALGATVAGQLALPERQAMEHRWLEASLGLIAFLSLQSFQDARRANHATRAALVELLAALHIAEARVEAGELEPERAMSAVTSLLPLVAAIGRPAIAARIECMRKRLEGRLGAWSHARFESSRAEIQHRLGSGDVAGALEAAGELSKRAETAGDCYAESAFDRAMAALLLGRCFRFAGSARETLAALDRAEAGFQALAAAGNVDAIESLNNVTADRGDAWVDLGRWREAADAHERAIRGFEDSGHLQAEAVSRGRLASILVYQGSVAKGLEAHQAARLTLEQLGDRAALAVASHQLGIALQQARHFDEAETAYKESLRIETELNNRRGQAGTLGQLGSLYNNTGQHELAGKLFQQVSDLFKQLGDVLSHSRSLANLALALLESQRFDEARNAVTQAAQLEAAFGHVAEPWETWNTLHRIEVAAARPDAARVARSRAVLLYEAYRREGGEPRSQSSKFIAHVGQVLRTRGVAKARNPIPPAEALESRLLPMRQALLAIIDGSRDPRLAEDDQLDYDDAVELSLLLESLK